MEIFTKIISIILLLGLILVPIFLYIGIKKWHQSKFDFITYLVSGLIITAFLTLLFAWWTNYSNILLLKHYGGYVFNPDSNGYQVNYENVLLENLDKVKILEISVMGIGWPLKAIMTFEFYLPYLLVVYFIGQLIRKVKRKNVVHAPNTAYSK